MAELRHGCEQLFDNVYETWKSCAVWFFESEYPSLTYTAVDGPGEKRRHPTAWSAFYSSLLHDASSDGCMHPAAEWVNRPSGVADRSKLFICKSHWQATTRSRLIQVPCSTKQCCKITRCPFISSLPAFWTIGALCRFPTVFRMPKRVADDTENTHHSTPDFLLKPSAQGLERRPHFDTLATLEVGT